MSQDQRVTPLQKLLDELQSLLDASRDDLARLDDADLDRLGRLHRAVSTQLALLRGLGGSTRSVNTVNRLLARSHSLLHGRVPPLRRGGLVRQFAAFPATVRRSGRWHLLAATTLIGGGLYGYFGASADPEWALQHVMPGDTRGPYATRDELLESLVAGRDGVSIDGSEKSAFAAMLWMNNTRVALLAFFIGIAAGIPTILLLLFNGILLGVYTQMFHANGLAYEWWAWILPHGVTELLAIVLLAGGGLWIGSTVVAPGNETRAGALRALRPHAARLVAFAFPMLLFAALIESFLRQSSLGDPARYGFAIVTAVLWALWLGLGGRRAPDTESLLAARTPLERIVPMPDDDDLQPLVVKRSRSAAGRGIGAATALTAASARRRE